MKKIYLTMINENKIICNTLEECHKIINGKKNIFVKEFSSIPDLRKYCKLREIDIDSELAEYTSTAFIQLSCSIENKIGLACAEITHNTYKRIYKFEYTNKLTFNLILSQKYESYDNLTLFYFDIMKEISELCYQMGCYHLKIFHSNKPFQRMIDNYFNNNLKYINNLQNYLDINNILSRMILEVEYIDEKEKEAK